MHRPQFTLRFWMISVAILGIVLAMPPSMAEVQFLLLLAVPTAVIAQLPYRPRLAVEIVILLVLLVYSGWNRQSRFYAGQADRTRDLASLASDWAAISKNSKDRAILLRESAWFARTTVTLRIKAIRKGLIHGPSSPSGPQTRQENMDILDMLWEIQRHEDATKQAHKSSLRR